MQNNVLKLSRINSGGHLGFMEIWKVKVLSHHFMMTLYSLKSTPNPPPSNSLLSFRKVPLMSILYSPCSLPHPSHFHRSPNVSVPHCFVFPTPAPLVSCPPCCALCVSSHTSLDKVYKKRYYKFPETIKCLIFFCCVKL